MNIILLLHYRQTIRLKRKDKNMSKYFFKPRIGKDYDKGIHGLRTLVLGSHFSCPYNNCPHLKKECNSSKSIFGMDMKCPCYTDKENKNYYRLSNCDTIEIDSYLEGVPYPAFSAFTYIMLKKRDHITEEEKNDFWSKVAFTNYIQHYWPDGESPEYFIINRNLYDTDYEAFMQVITELKPQIILVWSKAIKDCLISHGNLNYFGMIDMPVISVYVFSSNNTKFTVAQKNTLLTKYNIIPENITIKWIESLFVHFFNNQDVINAFKLKTIKDREKGIGMAKTKKIKNIATLFKQLSTQKILIRREGNIDFGNNITNKHKEVFMKYIKQTFDVPLHTNKHMSDMFNYNFCHYHVTGDFEDSITKKMKAIFRMVDTKDREIPKKKQ